MTRALAPYEGAGWPALLERLGLTEERDYVLLLHVPPLRPIDLSEPEATRRSLEAAVLDPTSVVIGKTTIGHLMVAWQCGGVRGMASKTGESSGQGLRMARAGWGVAALLSTFTDGRILSAADTSWRHLTMLGAGRGNVLAVEVAPEDCARLRAGLAAYLEHPAAPARRFGLLLEPAEFEGGGCLSFGLWLAGQGGVLAGEEGAFRRRVVVREGLTGRRAKVLPTVEPYIPAALPPGEVVVPLAELRTRRWDEGRVLDELELVDGELLFAAVTALRASAGAGPDWRPARALPLSDPAVAAAVAAAARWAEAWPLRRIADAGGVSALVLERRPAAAAEAPRAGPG